MSSLFGEWNKLLLSEFFSTSACNEDVWIQTSRQELDSFGLHLGGADGLIEAVKLGPDWVIGAAGNVALAALRLVKLRNSANRSPRYADSGKEVVTYANQNAPTYLPYLALWVLASAESEDGFYAKVSSILGEDFSNSPEVTASMEAAWKDLQKWSDVELAGKFGRFHVRVLGSHRFVGIPRSQCMVSRKDAARISQLFKSCGLRPRQQLTTPLFRKICEIGLDANFLSSGLRYAIQHSTHLDSPYYDPLKRKLGGLLDAWNGRITPEHFLPVSGGSDNLRVNPVTVETATLALVPSEDDVDSWIIRWRFPAAGQASECTFLIEGQDIPARLELSGDCFSSQGYVHQDVCRTVLSKSATANVPIEARDADNAAHEVSSGSRAGVITKRGFRVLAWDAPDPRFGNELVERDLPTSGPIYLVCSSSNRNALERYLAKEKIANEPVPCGGLPNGWVLTCITKAEVLQIDQRQYLSNNDPLSSSLARIRFVGGRMIARGGSRLYASYDLPLAELDAPAGAQISADGIVFEEIFLDKSLAERVLIRRFRIRIVAEQKAAFDVQVSEGSNILCSARLRVSILEGSGVGQTRSFSLDQFGRSTASDVGLLGALIESRCDESFRDPTVELLHVAVSDIGEESNLPTQQTVSAMFLDSLAQLGSIGYGSARDQILRLAEANKINIQPALLFLDLKSRGHLEVQVDNKGHMVRIHAVPPTLYLLPAVVGDMPLMGVCGSLRLQDWTDLASLQYCRIFSKTLGSGRLPVVRLAAVDSDELKTQIADLGMLYTLHPFESILGWAASLRQAHSQLSGWGWQSFSADLSQLQRLHPNSAYFRNVTEGRMTVSPQTKCQLFRFEDPSVSGLQVYVLGTREPDHLTQYSFVHDSRWGVWISTMSFALMLKERLGRYDAMPWPIHYDQETRDFWLPARLKPPSVIERALTMCSGSGPLEIKVTGESGENFVHLMELPSMRSIGFISPVYQEFATGAWLCYRWIPPSVARKVASLLDGVIHPFDRYQRLVVNSAK